ncbi:Aegerolysin domain-containing protein [Trichoderma evansii]
MGGVRTEDQWVSIRVYNRMRKNDISFKNANLLWGKFYSGSKSNEISATEVDKIVVLPGTTKSADSSGRAGAWSGTEGTLDLYDGSTKICYDPLTSDYSVAVESWPRTGALGNVDITVALFA